jgi:thymidine kinase
MAKLFFRYSSMGAGKSLDLIRCNYNYIENNKKTLCFTSAKDDRYGFGKISSRIGVSIDAISVFENMNIFEEVEKSKEISCVFVDEVQFFTKEQIYQLSDIVDYLNIPVICYGLRTDFKFDVFEASKYLLGIADQIEELKTLCWCGKKATTVARIQSNKIVKIGEQIVIGDTNYKPLCRKHYKNEKLSE